MQKKLLHFLNYLWVSNKSLIYKNVFMILSVELRFKHKWHQYTYDYEVVQYRIFKVINRFVVQIVLY